MEFLASVYTALGVWEFRISYFTSGYQPVVSARNSMDVLVTRDPAEGRLKHILIL